jgi:hypothetical protein
MPDLVTHYAVAHLAVRRWWQPASAMFLLGTILPDLLTRPIYIFRPEVFWLVMPLQTPVGMLVVSWMVAVLFKAEDQRKVFWSLFAGASLHFALDVLQSHIIAGYFWLWPFSWWTTEWGLFWPEDSLLVAPVLALAVVVLEVINFIKRRARSDTTQRKRAATAKKSVNGLN